MALDRRNLLKVGVAIAASSSSIAGVISAAEAREAMLPLRMLTKSEAATLARLAEQLVNGAEKAGVVHFVDYQLSIDPNDCLLMAKYFQVKPPYINFYRSGLKALNDVCTQQHKEPFHKLDTARARTVIDSFVDGSIKNWTGPPVFLFYMMTRSDAVDLVYGTPEGFDRLSIPYMAHIMPPENWQDD